MSDQSENIDSITAGLPEEQNINTSKSSSSGQPQNIAPVDIDKLDLPDTKSKSQIPSLPTDKLLTLENLPLIQEETRARLAKWLVRGFVATIVGIFLIILIDKIFYYSASDTTKEKIKDQTGTKDLVSLILTAQSSLVGAAIGFYFGLRENK
ncbi:hypothetical protein [Pseudanabaena mucicola]|uniref:hypothetical protein n=1 Tax=Pseudanabaena mucicola TaxID=71190 RepID=UPI00257814FE|nr:hypothetical protein [Pseudanabaena mucicola]